MGQLINIEVFGVNDNIFTFILIWYIYLFFLNN